ncbi:hypothetical protein RYX36_020347 [Vicia faba]
MMGFNPSKMDPSWVNPLARVLPFNHASSYHFNGALFRATHKLHFNTISRSFNEATLRFLDSLLVSKDVKSLIETRSSLKQLLKSESLSIIHSIAAESIHDKLVVLDFFVHAFALVGDLESCVALRYEALVMRDLKSASFQLLQVSPLEWLNFVEDAANNGFHSVAVKACENALWCIGNNDVQKLGRDMFS